MNEEQLNYVATLSEAITVFCNTTRAYNMGSEKLEEYKKGATKWRDGRTTQGQVYLILSEHVTNLAIEMKAAESELIDLILNNNGIPSKKVAQIPLQESAV